MASQERVGDLPRLTKPPVLDEKTSDIEIVLVLPGSSSSRKRKLSCSDRDQDQEEVGPPSKRKALKVLSRHSEYFKGCFSKRWNPEGKNSFEVHVKGDFERYERCLALMYEWDTYPPPKFTTIRDALDVLEPAAQFLCQDIIKGCLAYIACRPWSSQEKSAIHARLQVLGLPLPTSLVARLDSSFDGLELLTELFESCAKHPENKGFLVKSVSTLLEGQPLSSELVERVKKNLRGVWRKACSARRGCDTMELTSVLVDLNVFSEVAEAFVSASWLFATVQRRFFDPEHYEEGDEEREDETKEVAEKFYPALPGILKKMLEGGEVLDSRIRQGFLSSLLPCLGTLRMRRALMQNYVRSANEIGEAFQQLLSTLSSKEQGAVFKVWIAKGCPETPDLRPMFIAHLSSQKRITDWWLQEEECIQMR